MSVKLYKLLKPFVYQDEERIVLPELLVSQISVPRLLLERVSSGCSIEMPLCFFAKRGGIFEVIALFFTITCGYT